MRIAVAGGTGVVGQHTVKAAQAAGHEAMVIARGRGADVLTGAGLADALQGVDVVIDVTNQTTLSAAKARRFFETATSNLLAAEEKAGVRHHVTLSIVGIDEIDAAYYAGKLAQERAVMAGMPGPVMLLPKILMRPVAAREVGAYLVRVAEAGAVGRAQDLVGPRNESIVDLARRQLGFEGSSRRVIGMRLPGTYGRGLVSGSLRGGVDALRGEVTFDEWLRSEDHARVS